MTVNAADELIEDENIDEPQQKKTKTVLWKRSWTTRPVKRKATLSSRKMKLIVSSNSI
jgi:hypothetical protein